MSGVIIGGDPRFAPTGGGFGCEGNLSQVRVSLRDLGSGMDEGTAVASLILAILVMLVLSILFMTGVGSILDSRQMEVRWSYGVVEFLQYTRRFNFDGSAIFHSLQLMIVELLTMMAAQRSR